MGPVRPRLNGRVIANMPNANTVFIHKDTVGSPRMTTGPSGTWLQDQVFYPWGTSWHSLGTWQEQEFGDLDLFRTDDGFYHSLSRDYNPNVARWLSPDPSAAKSCRSERPADLEHVRLCRQQPDQPDRSHGAIHLRFFDQR